MAAPLSDAPTALDRARALIEPQMRLLGRLAEIGLDVAETVGRQARGEDEAPARSGDLSLAFARVSRAVRLTVALQQKLVDGLAALEAGVIPGAPAIKGDPDPDYVLKARVERIVERTAEAEHEHDAGKVDRLVAESAERLDDIDLYGDLLDRPMSEIVARIAEDIGLPLDWSRMAGEAWARTEMAQGQTGEPLAAVLRTLDHPPPPDPEGSGRRRALRLAATARRGRRAIKAQARGEAPEEEVKDGQPLDIYWLGPDGPYKAVTRRPDPPPDG
jgi:hypothetical protein